MLQLILSGQPELEEKLMRTDLRQLRQRIAVSARLEALSPLDTAGYISFRLEKAGCKNPDLFSREAVSAIWTASKGSPRTINVLCDHALVNAFAMGSPVVHEEAAREAVQDVLCVQLRESTLRKPGPYLVSRMEQRDSESDGESAALNDDTRGGRVG
jgi:general secretion pathway protein A